MGMFSVLVIFKQCNVAKVWADTVRQSKLTLFSIYFNAVTAEKDERWKSLAVRVATGIVIQELYIYIQTSTVTSKPPTIILHVTPMSPTKL